MYQWLVLLMSFRSGDAESSLSTLPHFRSVSWSLTPDNMTLSYCLSCCLLVLAGEWVTRWQWCWCITLLCPSCANTVVCWAWLWLLSSSGLCFIVSASNSDADRLPFLNICLGMRSLLLMHVSTVHTSPASFSHRGFPFARFCHSPIHLQEVLDCSPLLYRKGPSLFAEFCQWVALRPWQQVRFLACPHEHPHKKGRPSLQLYIS